MIMLTLLKHAYSTRLKSSKHAKMSAIIKKKVKAFLFREKVTNKKLFFNIEIRRPITRQTGANLKPEKILEDATSFDQMSVAQMTIDHKS